MLNILIDTETDKYNAIDDFHCFPKSFVIGEAKPKTNYVDVPYRNGSLDVSEAISPMRYKDRAITIPMRIVDENPLSIYDSISNAVSGKRCKVRLLDKHEEYEDYYYEGRVTISQLATSRLAWDFDLTMIAYPYKMKDVTMTVNSPVTLNFYNSGIDVIPIVTTSANISGTWNGNSFTMTSGTHEPANLKILHGNNTIQTSGTASLKIAYLNKRL